MGKLNLTESQKKALVANFLTDAKGNKASIDFINTFIETCENTGLDPFKRHIMASMRNVNVGNRDNPKWSQVWTSVVTIDGFRAIAESSGEYQGQECAWCGDDGVWKDVWISQSAPVASKVTVYRKGFTCGVSAVAKYCAYAQTNDIWKKFADLMVAKCAEALALRKAFPQQLGGLYTPDEMEQAHKSDNLQVNKPSEPLETIDEFDSTPNSIEWTPEEIKEAKTCLFGLEEMLVSHGYDATIINKTVWALNGPKGGTLPAGAIGDPEIPFNLWMGKFSNWSAAVEKKFPEVK